jgi:hypothetical protein
MRKTKLIKEVVKTRQLLIYDDSDRIRMALEAYSPEPKISIYKEDGTPGIEISILESDSDSRRIILYGKGCKYRMWIGCTDKGVGVTVYDKDGKYLQSFGIDEEKPKRPTRRKK